ncbi:DedA family protein [Terrilactibacillus sp. BCM23-1]|uniref:DedA family protein n=1 Tax=Terrilactibacillus tamarindi TaxID=2599694 RepID=A0A6N8CQD6_9BACI|nr:DedA family protein [Terrilactibacillus tamarindi]MTT31878.1 DedA family protein [Terrilactibacillus tamarindi]
MENWLTSFIEAYGYLGIFLLIAFENVFPPIPSEVILTFSGFMTHQSNLSFIGVVISATAGSAIGATILYGIGRLIHIDRLERFLDRYGYIVRVKKESLHRANGWFRKYGYWTILFCRIIPLIRSLISIPAGITKMNFNLFLLFTTIGTLIWNILLVSLGAAVGDNWEQIVGFFDIYSNLMYGIIVFSLVILIILFYYKNKKAR